MMPGSDARMAMTAPAGFGRVAVLLGGSSAEREISLMTGNAVFDALCRRDIDAHLVDPADGLLEQLAAGGFDRAWIALHGRGGEDGVVQAVLELLGLPYTGSGVLGCALGMDKLRTKRVFAGAGLGTPDYRVITGPDDFDAVIAALGLPLMIKPNEEGSSIGLSKVETAEQLPAAFEIAAACGCEVFAESWISGGEYTAAILQGEVLPLIRIDAANSFYDYQAKYFSDATRYVCPCGLPAEQERHFAAICLEAFRAVGCRGWGRVDFMLDTAGLPRILEVNTVPGMTSHSLVPMAAAQAGLDFDELVWRILETSLREGSHARAA